ncbi:Protein of unknown function (DUF3549) [Idiomarina sp. A28L]|uniref:DUF3549 family protein n=1 Tax=Idiomarina sp. A28L TaxID=1036674 RepID=UPI00021386DA|nr:DUF3549 family protein [Idiomarina sp. A28L]EGN75643.1 Protein of unknown function (DUF3549) [Idiomarina sp. A28L]
MQSIDTLSDFLAVAGANHQAKTEYRIYDLSRRVQPILAADFQAIERGERPFPAPRQQHAWLGVVLWSSVRDSDPYIWFVKLPLDERGLFDHAARQHFLSIIVEALGADPTSTPTAEQEQRLQQNPYIFVPEEARRAAFHAQVSADLEQPTSIHYEDALAWLQGQKPFEDWENLGVQGIHDALTRNISDSQLQQRIQSNLLTWPVPIQQALMEAMEHQELPATMAQNLLAQLNSSLAVSAQIILIRSLASQSHTPAMHKAIGRLLRDLPQQETDKLDLLFSLGARCWPALTDTNNLERYMTAIASANEDIFVSVFRDLVMLPELRGLLLRLFGSNNLNPQLQQALTQLVTRTRGTA